VNPQDARDWKNTVLEEVFTGIAASEALAGILIFKGARVLARQLPEAARQSLDIDANCSREFLTNYPDRQAQATILQGHFYLAVRRQFEIGSPVRYQLEEARVTPQPPKDHPLGWNAFEVQLRVSDMSRASQRGIPNLLIDIAHPEELTAHSTTTLEIGGNEIRAYALHRIAGEKVRAFLSSLPDYQAKTGRSGNIVRAKDIYDLARILQFRPLTGAEFWRDAAAECRVACLSRYVDCDGWASFNDYEQKVRAIYEREPTIPSDVSFAMAWQALREIVARFVELGVFPIHTEMPARPSAQ
jgi:hypothetical protein